MTVEKKAFGERIRNLRVEKGVSQGELAEYLNVTSSCVANWEIGSRAPDINIWGKLSEFFDVSVDYLCCRSNQKNYIDKSESTTDNILDLSVLSDENRDRVKKYFDFLVQNP